MMQLTMKGKEIVSHVVRGTSSGCDDGLHAGFCSGNAVRCAGHVTEWYDAAEAVLHGAF